MEDIEIDNEDSDEDFDDEFFEDFDDEIDDAEIFDFEENGELVWRAVKPILPNSFFLALIYCLSSVIDIFIAAFFFSHLQVAAVAIVTPLLATVHAVLLVFASGAFSNYTVLLGRGQRKKGYETLTSAFILIIVLGSAAAILANCFGPEISTAYGAVNEKLQELCVEYMGTAALSFPLLSLSRLLGLVLNAYGYHRDNAMISFVYFICDVLLSVGMVICFPNLGLAALGLGTTFATLISIVLLAAAVKKRSIHVQFRFNIESFSLNNLVSLARGGLYTQISDIVSAQTTAVVNSMIARSTLGPVALAMYSAVWSIMLLSRVSVNGVFYAVSSMQGFCYAVRDFHELKILFKRSLRATLRITILWSAVLLITLPLMMEIYLYSSLINGGEITLYVGAILSLIPAPAYAVVQLLKDFYDTTEQEVKAFIYAVVPGSVLFPIMMAVLLPSLGFIGMWIAIGGHTLLFLLFELGRAMFRKNGGSLYERMVYPKREETFPAVECMFTGDVDQISALSEQIHDFMILNEATPRVAYMTALCVDELATDAVLEHAESGRPQMQLKIISVGEYFRIIMVYAGEFYNPLDYEYSNDDFSGIGIMMVQKIAEKINFSYVYQMNVITMIIRK